MLTPVAEIRGDDKEVLGICQVLAEELTIHLLSLRHQGAHEDRHYGELTLFAVRGRRGIQSDTHNC